MSADLHPRLYFDAAQREVLRGSRRQGPHAAIWRNLVGDAERYAAQDPALDWIAPVADDPSYENLYDRFWAMLSDAALLEQLAFAAAYGAGDPVAAAARARLLAAVARWRAEVSVRPDYGTAYATTRVLKAIAVGYDLLWELLSSGERNMVRDMLADCAARLADEWFRRSDVAGPVGISPGLHSPHHASVEWSSFGVVALCLLAEVAPAAEWVAMTRRQFDEHLLAEALTLDGAQVEGTAFWSSTVLSQLQFLDPLRRCTGMDLIGRAAGGFDLRLALAAYRPRREGTPDGEPWYGDSTGMSAILYAAAAELGDPTLQRLAMAEPTTGRVETWPARSPRRGEQLRFAPGGYAYAWCRPDLHPGTDPRIEAWSFSSVPETYLRTGWDVDDLLVAIRAGRVSVYAAQRLAFEDLTPVRTVDIDASRAAGTGIYRYEPPGLAVSIAATGRDVDAQWARDAAGALSVRLDAARRTVVITRADGVRRSWAAEATSPASLIVRRGAVVAETSDGHSPDFSAGYGLLPVVSTDPRRYRTTTAEPQDGVLVVELASPALT